MARHRENPVRNGLAARHAMPEVNLGRSRAASAAVPVS
jgi:hypothetical protein